MAGECYVYMRLVRAGRDDVSAVQGGVVSVF